HLAGTAEVCPPAFPLGRPTAAELKADYAGIHARTLEWQDWARYHDVELAYENRVAKGGSTQTIPTHARIETIHQAAAVVGERWPERLERGRERLRGLRERYPQGGQPDRGARLVAPAPSGDVARL